ncbi:MAG: cobalamin biosynthesis protein [Lacrimispora sp.]|uniref:cobalt-precorrin 5A hydrolase n=1 Tax=Lacrimispora sp. TaxID=2719234 RepID=UPI0039E24338
MKRLSLICFTEAGAELCVKLMEGFSEKGSQCQGYGPGKLAESSPYGGKLVPLSVSLSEWTKEQFLSRDGIIFIGAAGIAVRAIAPFLKTKAEDPAVVVLDDMGRFSISLLSGHLGGANELAEEAAEISGGQAVITTATDIHGGFAVDLFAKKHKLAICEIHKIKEVSSAVLRGEEIGFFSDFPIEGELPAPLVSGDERAVNIWTAIKAEPQEDVLKDAFKLVPKLLVLGIGCRKGVASEIIEKAVNQVLETQNLSKESLAACASIDLKKEEPGLCEFTAARGIRFYTFPSEVLAKVEGEFSASSFVKQVTGVDNVCERAALACVKELGGGKLLVRKQAANGVTVAVAALDWKLSLSERID